MGSCGSWPSVSGFLHVHSVSKATSVSVTHLFETEYCPVVLGAGEYRTSAAFDAPLGLCAVRWGALACFHGVRGRHE